MTRKKPTTDAFEILYRRYAENDPEVQEALHEASANYRIALAVAEMRESLGLTQKQLADIVGTTATVIRRLEEANYEGPAATMIEKIAVAVKDRAVLSLRFVTNETTNGAMPRKSKRITKSKATVSA